MICVETRHVRAVLQAQINKTDRNDARGMAQMMRAGLYRPVHVKTLRSQKLRMLLTHRGGVWVDLRQVPIGRDRSQRRDIAARRRDDADDALRSGPQHAVPFDKMVLAQGLGNADCQAPQDEEGDRGPGASACGDHAPHLGRRHRVPLDPGDRDSMRTARI
jgi:hypothetical protein